MLSGKGEGAADVILVGAGIMSSTLGVILNALEPDWKILILESLDDVSQESSLAWNNAGTGHAALCELNYTPERADGSVDVSKALKINEAFEISKQCWSTLAQRGVIASPEKFIHRVPHHSFVRGEANTDFLRKRHEALKGHHAFDGMQFADTAEEIADWLPLMMNGREKTEKLAATRMAIGADVNFGELCRQFIDHLRKQGAEVLLRHKVTGIDREASGWRITAKNLKDGGKREFRAPFVFLGAGGGALPLLQKSGIPEGKGYGGFPVGGQWLRCDDPALAELHYAKVYGKAEVGTPPMSVPHLDTRVIDGKRGLLFGPYATFSTKYLRHGSILDMPLSFRPDNVIPMLAAGAQNIPLTQYLIGQVLQSPKQRFQALQAFIPMAKFEDWQLVDAGQRVQVIKKHPKLGGVLEFGTEVVAAGDGSLAALLGASPGASTSISIMLELLARCFPQQISSEKWVTSLQALIPSYGEHLLENRALFDRVRSWTSEILGLRAPLPEIRLPASAGVASSQVG
jgi:malate dehydrogenase (quinone)